MFPSDFLIFLQIILFLFITPGLPRVLIVSHTLNYGLKQSVWTAFGDISANIIQGILVGLGFWIAGVSSPVFWGVIASFFALIPVFGTAIVWVPAVIYLFLIGNYGFGVFLFLWGLLLIASIDNFIRMFMLDKELNIHPFLRPTPL